MYRDVHKHIRECTCQAQEIQALMNAITLYKMSPVAPNWAEAMVEYMTTNVVPKKMSKVRQRYLQKHSQEYCIIANQLYHRGKDGSLRICVTEAEYLEVLFHAHSCLPGGDFSAEVTAKAIMRAGLWWPTLFRDANEYVRRCDECQRYKAPIRRDKMPLRPMMGARAFAKWGIDFVGPIDPPAHRTHAQYIIVATDYVTKWVEAKATQKNDAHTTANFLYEYVFMRYGLPIEIVSDQGSHFINETIEYLLEEFMVIHKKLAPYHP